MILPIKQIQEVLSNYNLGELLKAVHLKKGFANTNFKISTIKGHYLFRIYQQQEVKDIEYEMRVLEILRQSDFPAAYPFRRKDGSYMTKTTLGNVAIYQFIEGHEPEKNPRTVAAIGKTTARLNSLQHPYFDTRPNFINIQKCRTLIPLSKAAPFQYPSIFKLFKKETEALLPHLEIPLPKGLIHSDIFPDNTIFQGDELIALIDFEPVCADHLLFEVCMTIHGFLL